MKDELYLKLNEVLIEWNDSMMASQAADELEDIIKQSAKTALSHALRFKIKGSDKWINVNLNNRDEFIITDWYSSAGYGFHPNKDIFFNKNPHLFINNKISYGNTESDEEISIYCMGKVTEIEILNLDTLSQLVDIGNFNKLYIYVNQWFTTDIRFICNGIKGELQTNIYNFYSGFYNGPEIDEYTPVHLTVDFSKYKNLCGALYFDADYEKSKSSGNPTTYIPTNNVYDKDRNIRNAKYWGWAGLSDVSNQSVIIHNFKNIDIKWEALNNSLIRICHYGQLTGMDELLCHNIPGSSMGQDNILYFYISECVPSFKNSFKDIIKNKKKAVEEFKKVLMNYIINNELYNSCAQVCWWFSNIKITSPSAPPVSSIQFTYLAPVPGDTENKYGKIDIKYY